MGGENEVYVYTHTFIIGQKENVQNECDFSVSVILFDTLSLSPK